MKLETLILQVNRLMQNFSPDISDKKKEEKINFLRMELKNITDQQLEIAVDQIIKDENIKKFPTLAQIRAYLPKQQNYNARQQLQDCDHCRDGVIPVWIYKERLGNYYQFSYACPFCEAGKAEQQHGTQVLPQDYHSIPYDRLRERPKIIVDSTK